ncbi:hypothetical protein MMC27_005094 [Xylographa pallens]|nr:hypothetical protein [Xylographa pallens]
MTSPRTPPLLAPYVILPQPSSLTLVTGVLGATTNWLILRFLAVALANLGHDDTRKIHISSVGDGWYQEEDEVRIVLGIDFVRHLKSGRVTFVDGLSELFTNTNKLRTAKSEGESGHRFVCDPKLDVVERTVLDAIEHSKHEDPSLERKRTLLVLDGLDLFIAATGWPLQEVNDMLEEWRECADSTSVFKQVYATIISTAADAPLLQSPVTPLETTHTAFVAGLAHEAGLVMSVRGLDTGIARDISGVIRITQASGWLKANKYVQASETSQAESLVEREMLFFIGGDGGIRVWERGA